MKAGNLYIILFIFTFLFVTSCFEQAQKPIEKILQISLDKGINKYRVRGVSAAVIFPNQKIWIGTSGLSHDTVTVKSDMLFPLGSITKNVVTALTLKLAEEGKLSLDDPISDWLPEYRFVNGATTIRQLLNHTSGIYMFWSNQKIWDDLKKDRTKVWTPKEVLGYIKEPYFEPGEGFRYSNTNYLLMAMIIEKATGSSLSAEFRNRFWQPQGIENAWLSIKEEIPDNQANVFGDNFNKDGSILDLIFMPRASHESNTYGSSGLFMASEDLTRWCQAIFLGEVLSPQSMKEVLTFEQGKGNNGLGVGKFGKRTGSGEKVVGQSGANIVTSAYMVQLPEHHFSIVVMINDFNHDCSHALTISLIAIVLLDLDAIGIIQYFVFSQYGLTIFPLTGLLIILLARYFR